MRDEDLSIILELQSPFRWQPVIRDENRNEFDLEQEDAGNFSFFNFCVRIVQFYDEYTKGNKATARELLDKLDKRLQELENSNCRNDVFVKSKDAISHVLLACQTQVAIFGGKLDDEVQQWMKRLKKFDEMDAPNKAAMYAIKACVHSLYSNDGLDTSLAQINTALSYDKDGAYWMFLKGTILQKIRPTNEVPSLQEREAFNDAFKKETSNPLFMVYFADSLREMCNHKPKTYLWFIAKSAQINIADSVKEKQETALELYRKSYEMKPNCPVIAYKCANGLLRLQQKFQDVKLVKKIISDCEKKFPDSGFGNLVCAMYHERIGKNIALTQRCLENCVKLNVFHGCMNMIRMKKGDPDIVERLEKMLDVFGEATKQEIIISQIISYYVFVAKNIEKACQYMLKYYRKKSSGLYLEKHKSCFEQTDGLISLVDVVTDQVKLKLRDRLLPKEERKFYNDFVRQMNFHNVEVLKGNPKNLLEQIKKSAVPKGKNRNEARSNEAQRNSSSQRNRQSNDDAKYAPRHGDYKRREDAPRDRRPNRENAQPNASPRRRDDRRPEDRRFEHRPPFDQANKRFGGEKGENARRNDASPRRRGDIPGVDSRPAPSDARSSSGLEARAKNVPRNDAGPTSEDRRPPPEKRADPHRAGERSAVGKTKATESDNQLRELMDLCREDGGRDLDAIFDKWKFMTLEKRSTGGSKIPHTVPEEYDRAQADRNDALDVAASKERSRRSKDGSPEDRRRDRSVSHASDRSHRQKHRHRKHKHRRSSESEDERRRRHESHRQHRRSEVGTDSDRSADRRSQKSHRHRQNSESASNVEKFVDKDSRKSHRKHRKSVSPSDRERSVDKQSVKSHRKHRKSVSPSDRERSIDRQSLKSHRKHRKSVSPSDRERSVVKQSVKSHRKHRKSVSPSDPERSVDRQSRKSHRRHRKSASPSDSVRSVDRRSRRSHHKHRKSESPSDSERSADRKREKERRSHHRSKKHSSTKRRRDHEKSSRRKKESKKDYSDSERGDRL